MAYTSEKRSSIGTDIIYTGRLGYPRIIGFIRKDARDCFHAEGGPFNLGEYRTKIAAKYAVIASFERLGGRTGNPADAAAQNMALREAVDFSDAYPMPA